MLTPSTQTITSPLRLSVAGAINHMHNIHQNTYGQDNLRDKQIQNRHDMEYWEARHRVKIAGKR